MSASFANSYLHVPVSTLIIKQVMWCILKMQNCTLLQLFTIGVWGSYQIRYQLQCWHWRPRSFHAGGETKLTMEEQKLGHHIVQFEPSPAADWSCVFGWPSHASFLTFENGDNAWLVGAGDLKINWGVPVVAQWLTNPSCGVGCRRGSDPALLWLWCRLVATAPIGPLTWDLHMPREQL